VRALMCLLVIASIPSTNTSTCIACVVCGLNEESMIVPQLIPGHCVRVHVCMCVFVGKCVCACVCACLLMRQKVIASIPSTNTSTCIACVVCGLNEEGMIVSQLISGHCACVCMCVRACVCVCVCTCVFVSKCMCVCVFAHAPEGHCIDTIHKHQHLQCVT